jgi:hypothetical protein
MGESGEEDLVLVLGVDRAIAEAVNGNLMLGRLGELVSEAMDENFDATKFATGFGEGSGNDGNFHRDSSLGLGLMQGKLMKLELME